MPRAKRRQHEGDLFHVTARGIRRSDIVKDDVDRKCFMALLEQATVRYGWALYSYCLMTNHYHLILRLDAGGTLAAGMHRLNGIHARRFNERHGHVGHVFEARYAAEHLQQRAHLLACLRYVPLNPVRAGLVASPDAYAWSSYGAIAGYCAAPPFLAVADVHRHFATARAEAQLAFRSFVLSPVHDATACL